MKPYRIVIIALAVTLVFARAGRRDALIREPLDNGRARPATRERLVFARFLKISADGSAR